MPVRRIWAGGKNEGKIVAGDRVVWGECQSGFVASFVYTSKIACEQIAAVKIYGISFMRMDGSIFSGFDRYELELAGIIMK